MNIRIDRVLTDNGASFRSRAFRALYVKLGIKHTFTRPYTPRMNGKVERMIQTLLREWAYHFRCERSAECRLWLDPFLHFYNCHRAHSSLGDNPPISRLARNNVMKRNS